MVGVAADLPPISPAGRLAVRGGASNGLYSTPQPKKRTGLGLRLRWRGMDCRSQSTHWVPLDPPQGVNAQWLFVSSEDLQEGLKSGRRPS